MEWLQVATQGPGIDWNYNRIITSYYHHHGKRLELQPTGQPPIGMIMQKITRLMHVGQLPQEVRDQLVAEGDVLYVDEGIPVTAILQGFKAAGFFCGYRRMSFVGFLVLSDRRIVVRASFYNEASVNVGFDDPQFQAITFRTVGKRLEMTFDAKGLIPRTTGTVTLRVRLSDPARVSELLRAKGAAIAGERAHQSVPPNAV